MPRRGLVLVLTLLLAGGCDGTPSAESEPRRAGTGGVSVELPIGWSETRTEPGRFTDPVVRLAVASGPIAPGDAPCQVSAYDFPADEVALVLVEWTTPLLLRGTAATPRPDRFTDASLRVARPPAIECFDGPGGSVQFVEAGRLFGAYLLLGPKAPAARAGDARAVLETLRIEMMLPAPVGLVQLAPKRLAHCRRSALIRSACPTRVPRVRAPYLSHLARDMLESTGQLDVFDLERGAQDSTYPGSNRPPRFAHIGVLAGDTERIAPWVEPWARPAEALRDGVLRRRRALPVSFGLVTWGDTRGLLFLAPAYPTGGYLGDHLVYVWRADGRKRAVSLHAWEPLSEAAATLRAMTLSG